MLTNDTLRCVSLIPVDTPEDRVWSKPWLLLRATSIQDATDDICPIMITETGRYVGANHGWFDEETGVDMHPATRNHTSAATDEPGALVVQESYEIATRDGLGMFGTVENTYRFTADGTHVDQAFTAAVSTSINLGVTQASPVRVPRGGTLRQSLPGVPGWSDPVDLSTMTEQLNVTGLPQANTVAQWAYDRHGRRCWGIELDVLSDRHGTEGRSWSLPLSRKNYPHVTWGTRLEPGERLTGTCARRYLAP